MQEFFLSRKNKKTILALGAESAGNFSVFNNGKVYFSNNFGDLLEERNFKKFQNEVLNFLKKNKIKPNIILTDLHPLYKTTLWGAELAKKFKAEHIQVQHHLAHIFSAVGESIITPPTPPLGKGGMKGGVFGIALDGTGYGLDGKIWGGEVFAISNFQIPISKQIQNIKSEKLNISRIGHLENQVMIGGDLAIHEPARMLIAILAKITNKSQIQKIKHQKNFIYQYIKKHYTRNQFELLYNQLQNNFNCVETSSTGRVLDAVSILLGFTKNERKYKHSPIDLLEKNSANVDPYEDLKPLLTPPAPPLAKGGIEGGWILQTTPFFEYLIKNLHKDKKRLAATAQLYIAQGFYKIISKSNPQNFYLAGGIANNKIISNYLEPKGAFCAKKVPRGDAGLSFGQIIYYLTNSRN